MKTSKRFSKLILVCALSTGLSVPQTAQANGAASIAMGAAGVATSVAIASMGTAGALKIPCTSGTSPMSCALMGLALVQLATSISNLDNSKRSAAALTGGLSSGGFTNGSTGTDGLSTGVNAGSDTTTTLPTTAQTVANLNAAGLGNLVSDYKSMQDLLDKSGVSISKDGSSVTLPNGKKVPTSSFGSADGMKAAGFSDLEIANTQRALDDAKAKMGAVDGKSKVAGMTNDVGGGGGGGGGAGRGGGDEASGNSGGFDPFGGRMGLKDKNDKGVAGMSKKLGSDNIGVSGDNIFEMVHRRYDARDKANSFIKN